MFRLLSGNEVWLVGFVFWRKGLDGEVVLVVRVLKIELF